MSKTLNSARQSNIELLRIIAMIMIIAHHFAVHGGFDGSNTIIVNKLWLNFLSMGGKIGVDIFVLISGYFLISSKVLKVNKVIKLWGQVFFYSVVIYAIFVLVGVERLSNEEILNHIAPITFSEWWFASTYFVLYLLSPYLNKFLNNLEKKHYTALLLLLIVMWCVIPSLTGQSFQGNSLFWFMTLYSVAAYIRLFGQKLRISCGKSIVVAIITIIITYIVSVCIEVYKIDVPFFIRHIFEYDMQRVTTIVVALFMFLGFLRMDIGHHRIINLVSAATFGIYLIHDNRYIREYLWESLFVNASFSEKSSLIPYSIFAILTVYIVCLIIELMRIFCIERSIDPLINRITDYLYKMKNRLLRGLTEKY